MSIILYFNNMIINNIIYSLWYIFKYIIVIYNYVIKFFQLFKFNTENTLVTNLLFIKNNSIILENNIKYIYSNPIYGYDYIIYKYKLDNILFISILYNIDNLKINNTLLPCSYKFIYINIKINNNNIDITNILNNFYVVDSILFNNIFMKWLIEYKLNLILDNYTIIILDNNFKEFIIDNTQYIKLYYNNYDIITN